ncbi:ATP-binding protein [Actinoplanes sp. NPDC049596]|uniref:AlbA family DNA-binding domain-containing protein n=1 Tax=unclassified Actinoplanes TaxID=2626549 RepID=UPI003439CE91
MDSVPNDGAVDDERLHYLLGLQTELPSLDYKQKYDLGTAGKSRFDFVKDCAAMLSRPHGGYLVVGVDDRGEPVATGLRAADFDSSRLRDMLAKHLEGSIDVRSAVHEVATIPVVLIYLARRTDGLFPIVKSDFTYTEPGGTQRTALRAGDVYVRDGTSTRRWRSADLPSLLSPYVEVARREERARIDDIVAVVRQQYRGLEAALGPATALTWHLGQDDFDTAIVELSRRHDQAPIRLLGFDIARDGCALLDDPGDDAPGRLQDLLDRAVSALAYGIVLDDRNLAERLTRALHEIYVHGLVVDQPRNDVVATVQFTIVARVLAAIALAARIEAWWAVRPLTLRPVGTEPGAYERASWLRHATVWNSRWNTAPTNADGHPIPGVLIAQAREIISRVPALRRDVAAPVGAFAVGETPQRGDTLLDSLCQADLLWCLVAFLHGGKHGTRDFYTSFAALYEHRVQPMVRRLLTDDPAVDGVFPDTTPEDLREALADVLKMASSEGARFGHFDFGVRDLA